MNLPITFPSDADVNAPEAARFRALSPEDRVRTMGEMFVLYRFLQETSTDPEALARVAHARKGTWPSSDQGVHRTPCLTPSWSMSFDDSPQFK
jgi:hypothetical protein